MGVELVANLVLVLLSLLLGTRLLRQYQRQPHVHTLWYALGLLVTAVAALPELIFQLTGGLPQALWWLYWASASSLVGFLAVGTAYLMSKSFGKLMAVAAVVLAVWVAAASLLTAGPVPSPVTTEIFRSSPTAAIKLPFLLQNIGGSLVIFMGAAISFYQTRRPFAVLIALGTLVFAMGGSASGLMEYGQIFAFTQLLGIILLYAGVSQSLVPGKRQADS